MWILRIAVIANLALQSKTGNIWNYLSIIHEYKNSICDASDGFTLEKIETDLKILNQGYTTKDRPKKLYHLNLLRIFSWKRVFPIFSLPTTNTSNYIELLH